MSGSGKTGRGKKDSTMTDDAAEMTLSREIHALESHYCEYPGCLKRGSLGYDVGDGENQFFCHEHRWSDYRRGGARRSFFDEEAAGIEAIMVEPRSIAS
ncbi:hypothetical protein CCGE531_27845 (plasmid) [Rhizobium sp. CCGE531]|nr:hypothetical protein CCGE531_27845 [Rhizobium sp. CCGE531]AYG76273.1 hypothetical protein CCGE532_27335 [Rhizobium sp. CCGE532]